jgi:hypothetical protein
MATRASSHEAERHQGGDAGCRVESQELGQERAGADRHRRDRREQRPAIDPAGHPGPALADEPAAPRIDPAGDRELRHDLAEHKADQHLAGAGHQVGPQERRTGRLQRDLEHRIDADHRREIGESQGEILPERHRAVEFRGIAERAKLLIVGAFRRARFDAGCPFQTHPIHCPALAPAGRPSGRPLWQITCQIGPLRHAKMRP